ncbi:unnamed protein product [Linum trigynum]|uniref:UBN2 domain-containing protein n=1 Tax=Linum trigynum TaxID=586398 RepID=A0AAV2FQZ9_9ROSI
MENLLRSKEYWPIVQQGFKDRKGEELSKYETKALDDLKLKGLKAKNYLFCFIDKTILNTISKKGTTKDLWDSMKVKYQGNAKVQKSNLHALSQNFEIIEIKGGESVTNYFSRVMTISNAMRNSGEAMTDVQIVEKIHRTLTEKFNYVVCSIEE